MSDYGYDDDAYDGDDYADDGYGDDNGDENDPEIELENQFYTAEGTKIWC